MKYSITKTYPNIINVYLYKNEKIMLNPDNIFSLTNLVMRYETNSNNKFSTLKKVIKGNKVLHTYLYNTTDHEGLVQIVSAKGYNNIGYFDIDGQYSLNANRLIGCTEHIEILEENRKLDKPMIINGNGTIFINCFGKIIISDTSKNNNGIMIQKKSLIGFKEGSQYERFNPYEGLTSTMSNVDIIFYKLLSGIFILDCKIEN